MNHFTRLGLSVGACVWLLGCSNSEQAKRAHFENGNRFLAAGKTQEAIVEYRNAIREDAKYGVARLKLSEAYQAAGNANQAFREAVRAADLLPQDNAAQIRAAKFLMLAGRFEDAKTRVQPVTDRDPTNVEAQLLLGNALVGLKDLEGAIREIEEAVKLDPSRAQTYSNLAAVRAQQGDREQARAAFEMATAVDPKSIVARLALAYFRWTGADVAGTEDALRAAVAIDSKNPLANRAIAAFYISTKRAAMAEPHLKILAESGVAAAALQLADYYLSMRRVPDATAVLQTLAKNQDRATVSSAEIRLAAIAYDTNDKARGHSMVDTVIARDPASVQALVLKSQWLLSERKPQEALRSAQAAAKADPRSVSAHYYAGVAYNALGQRTEAKASFNEVLRINPRLAAAQMELSRLNLLEGAADTAVTFAESALANAPGNAVARVELARGLLGRRDLERAGTELATLLKEYPQSSVVHALNGALKLQRNDGVGARVAYERALSLEPDSTEAFAGLVGVDLLQNRAPQARARIEARLSAEPNRIELLLISAHVYGNQRDFSNAEATLRRAIQLDAASPRAYSMLASVLVASGKLDAARVEFDQIAQREPRNLAAQTMAAMIVESQNKTAEAKKRYQAIVNADPTAAMAANNLAWIYQEENDRLDEALNLAQGAAARLPDSGEVYDTIGMIYIKKALPALAVGAFEKGIEKQPDNPVYHYHLAVALRDSGDLRRARAAAEQAIKLRPAYPDAQKLLAAMKG